MEQRRVYKFNFSRQVILLGLLQILIAAGVGYVIYTHYEGDYISVWYTSVILALMLLLVLSIPQRVIITPSKVSISCVLELKEINIDDIVTIKRVNPRTLKWCIPLFAGFNFFGYYGLYFDLVRAERVRLYATEWRNLIEIVDIYDDRYYISCRDGEALVRDVVLHALRKQIRG